MVKEFKPYITLNAGNKKMNIYIKALFVSMLLAFVISCILLFIGFQHNSQQEFLNFETGEVDYKYSMLFLVASFFAISGCLFLIGSSMLFFVRLFLGR